MYRLQKTILIICLLCPLTLWAQRRFEVSERWEYQLEKVAGFSFTEMDSHTDAFWGLHASQYVGSHNLFGFSVEGAYSTFTHDPRSLKEASLLPGGGAAGFKFLYEYQYSGILIQTGFGVGFQQVYTNLRDTSIYHYNMHDLWDPVQPAEYTLKHDFYHRQDMSRNLYAQIPIYAGHYILGQMGVAYFLAGVHVDYAFWGQTQQKLEGSTMALYEPYLGIWKEMDNHGYRKDVPIERNGSALKLKIDVVAHFEMGYEYSTYHGPHNYRISPASRTDCRLRFAGFLDYGILNICPRTDNVLYDTPLETIYDFPTYRMDHVYSTVDAKNTWMRNLYAGIRFTVLFAMPRKEHCILCDPWRH